MELITLLGTVMGLGFVSGINLYATILTIGLGLKLGLIHLAPEMSALADLSHPMVLVAATIAYMAEFFADKVPWVDSLWDTIHTLIRPMAAAVIGVKAIGSADPVMELAVILLCGTAALSTHTTKAGVRFLVNQSPEPFSNIAVSLTEDVAAVGGALLAVTYPGIMLTVVCSFMVGFALIFPKMVRLLKAEIMAVGYLLFQKKTDRQFSRDAGLFDSLPEQMVSTVYGGGQKERPVFCVKGITGKGFPVSRNRTGFLYMTGGRLAFVTKKSFRVVDIEIGRAEENDFGFLPKLLFDRILVSGNGGQTQIHLFKRVKGRGEKVFEMIKGKPLQALPSLSSMGGARIPEIEGGRG